MAATAGALWQHGGDALWMPPLSPPHSPAHSAASLDLVDVLALDWLLAAPSSSGAVWPTQRLLSAPPVPAARPPAAPREGAAPAPPPKPTPAAAERPWRCLDRAHGEGCTSCVPAPPPSAAKAYKLVSADGTGAEKRLRALLSRCPEWLDAAERARLAAELEARGELADVASLLRSHTAANMRKQPMLNLAYLWRYASDCWSRKAEAAEDGAPSRKRCRRTAAAAPASSDVDSAARADHGGAAAADPPPAAVQEAALALSNRTFTSLHVAEAQALELMVPLIDAASAAWTGPDSLEAYARCSGAGMTWARLRSIEGALDVTTWLQAVIELRLRALRSWRDTLGANGERAAAYTVDVSFNTPESELEALRYILGQSLEATTSAAAALAAPDGSLKPQDAAWVLDFQQGYSNALTMIAAAHAFLARQRMEPLRNFLNAAEAVLEGMDRYCRMTSRGLRQRLLWVTEWCELQGPAAGDERVARATLAPLVARLRLNYDDTHGARLLALSELELPAGTPPPRFTLV